MDIFRAKQCKSIRTVCWVYRKRFAEQRLLARFALTFNRIYCFNLMPTLRIYNKSERFCEGRLVFLPIVTMQRCALWRSTSRAWGPLHGYSGLWHASMPFCTWMDFGSGGWQERMHRMQRMPMPQASTGRWGTRRFFIHIFMNALSSWNSRQKSVWSQALLGAGSFLQEEDLKGRDVLEPGAGRFLCVCVFQACMYIYMYIYYTYIYTSLSVCLSVCRSVCVCACVPLLSKGFHELCLYMFFKEFGHIYLSNISIFKRIEPESEKTASNVWTL